MFGSCRSNSSCLTNLWPWFRSSHLRYSIKKGVLKNFPKFIVKHLCQSLFFNKVVGLIRLARVFSYEFCGIFKSTFFIELLWATASFGSPKSVSLHCNRLFFYGHMLSSAVSLIFPKCFLLTSIFAGFKSRWAIPLLWRNWIEQSNLNLFSEKEKLHNLTEK